MAIGDTVFQVFYLDIAYVAMAQPKNFKHMFQVFQIFQTYVISVSSGCCTCRSEYYICCYAYARIFQVFHLFQTYVANISFECFTSRSGVAWRWWLAYNGVPHLHLLLMGCHHGSLCGCPMLADASVAQSHEGEASDWDLGFPCGREGTGPSSEHRQWC
jgi:hypothetical protein